MGFGACLLMLGVLMQTAIMFIISLYFFRGEFMPAILNLSLNLINMNVQNLYGGVVGIKIYLKNKKFRILFNEIEPCIKVTFN